MSVLCIEAIVNENIEIGKKAKKIDEPKAESTLSWTILSRLLFVLLLSKMLCSKSHRFSEISFISFELRLVSRWFWCRFWTWIHGNFGEIPQQINIVVQHPWHQIGNEWFIDSAKGEAPKKFGQKYSAHFDLPTFLSVSTNWKFTETTNSFALVFWNLIYCRLKCTATQISYSNSLLCE